jgi:hypothetical protein
VELTSSPSLIMPYQLMASLDGPWLLLALGIPGLLLAIRSVMEIYRGRKDTTDFLSQLTQVREREDKAAEQLKPEEDTAFTALWAATRNRIDTYHSLALAQAQKSFLGTQIATYAGFVIIVGLGIAAAAAPTFAGSVTAATVGVIGGGLSTYVGSTFMKSQAQATDQLRQFFNQPMEFTRLLSIERLLEDLSEADKSAAILKIVDKMNFSIEDVASRQ